MDGLLFQSKSRRFVCVLFKALHTMAACKLHVNQVAVNEIRTIRRGGAL